MNIINNLPKFVGMEILSYLTPVEMAKCRVVCKRWKKIIDTTLTWPKLCASAWPALCKGCEKYDISLGDVPFKNFVISGEKIFKIFDDFCDLVTPGKIGMFTCLFPFQSEGILNVLLSNKITSEQQRKISTLDDKANDNEATEEKIKERNKQVDIKVVCFFGQKFQ